MYKFSKEALVEIVSAFVNAYVLEKDASQQFRDMDFDITNTNELALSKEYYDKYPRMDAGMKS